MTKDLFEHVAAKDRAAEMPLAARVRPTSIDIFAGHAEWVGEGAPLRAALERDEVWSVVLWGPPGTGKTTLSNTGFPVADDQIVIEIHSEDKDAVISNMEGGQYAKTENLKLEKEPKYPSSDIFRLSGLSTLS